MSKLTGHSQDSGATHAACLQKGTDVPVSLTIKGMPSAVACCQHGVLSLTSPSCTVPLTHAADLVTILETWATADSL